MTARINSLADLTLDGLGRTVLSEELLGSIEHDFACATAGGVNAQCTNGGGCNGTTNTRCTNSMCEGSTNTVRCFADVGGD